MYIFFHAGIGKFKGDRELKGYVDEFYIFNRTLTEDELKQLHNRCKGPKASQILHLAFENTTSENDTTVEDTSLQGNDGSFIGALVPGRLACYSSLLSRNLIG